MYIKHFTKTISLQLSSMFKLKYKIHVGWWNRSLNFCLHKYWNYSLPQLPFKNHVNLKFVMLWHCKCFRIYKFWSRELCLRMTNYIIWFNELCLKDVLEIAWCINLLLALGSFICRCFRAQGYSVCWVYEKIFLDPMTMFLVWWLTISDSHHILHTDTRHRGDYSCKCWGSSCNCAVLHNYLRMLPSRNRQPLKTG